MGRKKLKLQWIINDAARKSTYQKRAKSLLKKAMEISTLCGVDTCAIVNSPYDPQPEVWPSPSEAERVLMEFKGRPDNDHIKKRFDQDKFLRQRITKANAQLSKHQKKNDAMEMENFIIHLLADESGLQGLTFENCSNLAWSIDKQMRVVSQRMESLHLPAPQPSDAPAGVFMGQPNSSTAAPAGSFMGQSRSSAGFIGQSSSFATAPAGVFMGQSSGFATNPAGFFTSQSSSSATAPAGVSIPEMNPPEVVLQSLQRQFLMNMNISMPPQSQPRDIMSTSSNPGGQDFTFPSLDYSQILMHMNMPPQPQKIVGTSSNPGGQDFTFPSLDNHCDQETSFWGSPDFP